MPRRTHYPVEWAQKFVRRYFRYRGLILQFLQNYGSELCGDTTLESWLSRNKTNPLTLDMLIPNIAL